MASFTEDAKDYFKNDAHNIALSDIDPNNLPQHISIIMDGNGRWAKKQGLVRTEGHKAGVAALKDIITSSVQLKIPVLSAYAFSTENWKRPASEVNFLMDLFAKTLLQELPLFHEQKVKLELLGDLDRFPKKTREVLDQGLAETKDYDTMVLALCVNYGGRADIVHAIKNIAHKVQEGIITPGDIDEDLISQELYTHGLPDPELLIRTSGEMRLSNYLLYQCAYAEFYTTDVLWPDFNRFEFLKAIKAYQGRARRFGGV